MLFKPRGTGPLAVGLKTLGQLFPAQGLAIERVHHHLAFRQIHLDHEMSGETDSARVQIQAGGQLQPQHRQRDGNTPSPAQQRIQVAVIGVVIVVDIATKPQILKEELVQQAQLLQRRCVAWQATLQARQQLVDSAQHLLNIQLGIIVQRQTGGCFKQRKVLVALNKAGKILQRRRNNKIKDHGSTFSQVHIRPTRCDITWQPLH